MKEGEMKEGDMKTTTPRRVYASRAPALWGEHRFWTRRMLWEYIAHGISSDGDAGPRARTGRHLEAGVLAMAAEDLLCEVIHLPQDVRLEHPGMLTGCIADGYVQHPQRGPGLISVKCVSLDAWRSRWLPMEFGVPRDVEIQLQTELEVWRAVAAAQGSVRVGDLELPAPQWGCVAALQDLDVHLFERQVEPGWGGTLGGALRTFYESVEANAAPSFDYVPAELPLAQALWPGRSDDDYSPLDTSADAVADDEAQAAIMDLLKGQMMQKDGRNLVDGAKVRLLELAGDDHNVVRSSSAQCRITRYQVKPTVRECEMCGHQMITRAGGAAIRFTARED